MFPSCDSNNYSSGDTTHLISSACQDFDLQLFDNSFRSPIGFGSPFGWDSGSNGGSWSPCQDIIGWAGDQSSPPVFDNSLQRPLEEQISYQSVRQEAMKPSPPPSHASSSTPRKIKMHEWQQQEDPELEHKRVRALKARHNRQRAKLDEEHLQASLEQVRAQVALLKQERTRRKNRIAVLEAHMTALGK